MADTGQERGNAALNLADGSSDHNLEEAMSQLRVSDGSERGGNTAQNVYPDRPGEPNCNFYMRTGTCAYGTNCRYNHPTYIVQGQQYVGELPQREGQPDCQYYIKTGTCRYGSTCKYHHPSEKLNNRPVYYNSYGLPIREGEKPCPYYMKTGYCKFSTACKFSHPEATAASGMMYPLQSGTSSPVLPQAGLPLMSSFSGWPVSRAPFVPNSRSIQGIQPYVPVMVQANPNSVPNPGWSTYMGNNMNAIQGVGQNEGMLQNANHSQESPNSNSSNSHPVNFTNLPERPDQPDCQYFIKTGNCKYGPSCKYHHPKERNPMNQIAPPVSPAGFGPLGLPLRPGHPVCTYYGMYGTCKYGTNCKYDHPLVPYYNYPMTAYSLTDPYGGYTDQRNSQVVVANPSVPVEQLGSYHEEQQVDGPSLSESPPEGTGDHQN